MLKRIGLKQPWIVRQLYWRSAAAGRMAVLAATALMLLEFAGLPAQAAEPGAPRVFQDCGDCPVMVEVPPGEVVMGE